VSLTCGRDAGAPGVGDVFRRGDTLRRVDPGAAALLTVRAEAESAAGLAIVGFLPRSLIIKAMTSSATVVMAVSSQSICR
jgi:hypothetical protein